jgi:hypothetical protein
MSTTEVTKTAPVRAGRVNYLNNRDILKEIHSSKSSYCYFKNPADHQFDAIVYSLDEITPEVIAEAKDLHVDRIKRATGEIVPADTINLTDLVFRVMTWEHIPMAPKKATKAATKAAAKKKAADLFDFEENDLFEEDAVDLDPSVTDIDMAHIRVNFPPFDHYRFNTEGVAELVGRSHWKGDLETGEFSKDHGQFTRKLAHMFIKLCERYATRSNWRGYTYNEEMRGQALLQLSQIGLQFNEAKSQNPFAYYTATITNSFTRVLNLEKRNQNIRDDILEINGLNPSWTRQNSTVVKKLPTAE